MASSGEGPKIPSDVAAGVTSFDSSKLNHVDAQEKNQLPSNDGKFFMPYSLFVFNDFNICHLLISLDGCIG